MSSGVSELPKLPYSGLPVVKRELDWVRLAQDFPVRIRFTESVPPDLLRVGAISHGDYIYPAARRNLMICTRSRFSPRPPFRVIWSELAPRPGRVQETIRITVAALLVTVVMLTFRMPFLFAGPYLTFILSQRDTMLTRALAIASLLMVAIASVLVYAVALLAWNVAWLRVSLLALVFFMGFFLMRTTRPARDSPRAACHLFAVCLRL